MVNETLRLCEEKKQRTNEPLAELGDLLKSLSHRAYEHMADIDQQLRGRGYPDGVPRRTTDREFKAMEAFIDQRIHAEHAMTRPKNRINDFYEEHPFLFWLIALLVSAVVGVIAT